MAVRSVVRRIAPDWIVRAYRARYFAERAAPVGSFLRELCPAGKLAVDIGGNRGGYTWVLRDIASQVHVFEPNPRLRAQLRWAFLFDRRVHVHGIALSDSSGTAMLRLPFHNGMPLDGLATIEVANKLSWAPVRELPVETASLDSVELRNVGFAKIDVEGHELSVLRGGIKTISRERPTLLIEASEKHRPSALASVWDFLRPIGYSGRFQFAGEWLSIEKFDVAVHQRAEAMDELARQRGEYVSDFVFAATPGCVAEGFRHQ